MVLVLLGFVLCFVSGQISFQSALNGNTHSHSLHLGEEERNLFFRDGFIMIRQALPWLHELSPELMQWMNVSGQTTQFFQGPWQNNATVNELGTQAMQPLFDQLAGTGRYHPWKLGSGMSAHVLWTRATCFRWTHSLCGPSGRRNLHHSPGFEWFLTQ